MADSKITALTALTAADPVNDMFPVVDVSDTTMAASGTTKKISVNNILSSSPTASGALTVTGLVTAGSATITGDLTVDTSTLKVDSTNNRVGIGTATPAYLLDIADASSATRFVATNTNNSAYGAGIYLKTMNGASMVSNATLATSNDGTFNLFTGTSADSTKLSINTSGNVNVALGNVVMGTSGKGIDFSATTSGSGTMTSELLNDYEEGTFTPVLTTDAVNFTSVAYIIQQAKYTKIGNLVTISGTIYTSAVVKGLASGNVVITGLPFAQPGGDVLGGGNCNVSELWLADNPIEFVVSGSSVILLKRATSTGASVNLVVADVGTSASANFVRFIGQYYV
jgi:hypothetical protein